jgi:3-phenylpropionate/cinnamic acid dioxygenase small subunit
LTANLTSNLESPAGDLSLELQSRCARFLHREARYLDHRQFNDWLSLLAEDLLYEMPIRLTMQAGAEDREFDGNGFHMKETYESMKMRVHRMYSGHAYAEDPPSRTQRIVANIDVLGHDGAETEVVSNFLCYRSAGDDTAHDLIAGERADVLRETASGLRLARRVVRLAHTTLVPPNMALFL